MDTCKNSNEPVNGNYCPNCGKTANLKRIDGRYIIHEIASAFNAERGWLYTLKKMLISPGESVRRYITEDRSRFVKPVAFVIITSLIYTLVSNFFHIDANEFQTQLSGETEALILPTQVLLINWTIDYNGYATLIVGLFMALWVKLFFRKSGYNLFEIFVLFCYISGFVSLFSSIFFIIQGVTSLNLIYLTMLISTIYYTWSTGQFFNGKKAGSYIKAFISCLLGVFTFSFLITFIAIIIDFNLLLEHSKQQLTTAIEIINVST